MLGGTLQPAELAKPATVLLLAAVGAAASLGRTPRLKMVFMLLLGVIPLLLIGLQPDWGTAMVFVPVLLAMAFVAGLPWRWLLFGLLAALLAMPLVYKYKLKPYQQERLVTFLKPGDDTSRAGYNAHQSLLAVGSGGFWGKGFMRGNQHVLGFLPRTVAPTDFIFTVVAEETGFVGAAAMVLAFLGIITCCLWTGFNAADELGRLIAVGVATLFLVHVFVNVGMTVQVCPIVGIPLPFVSYGGSSLVTNYGVLGIALGVGMRPKFVVAPEDLDWSDHDSS